MKTLTCKSLKALFGMIAFVLALLLVSERASAQNLSQPLADRQIPVTEFSGIDISGEFDVTLSRGSYGVRLTVDKELDPYVEIYVKGRVLYLDFDEKAVPKATRQLYKGRNGLVPTFRVVVSAPEVQSVALSDYATLTATEEFLASQFELTATGRSEVKSLSVKATTAKVSLKKNAVVNNLTLRTDRGVEAGTENNANLNLFYTGSELALSAQGSSKAIVDGGPCKSMRISASGNSLVSVTSETETVDLTADGSSEVNLTGKAVEMVVKGSRNATVDAFSMPLEMVDATLSNNAYVTVSVSRKVIANLVGGSSLYYSGTPEFQIVKILRSTLAPYGTK